MNMEDHSDNKTLNENFIRKEKSFRRQSLKLSKIRVGPSKGRVSTDEEI